MLILKEQKVRSQQKKSKKLKTKHKPNRRVASILLDCTHIVIIVRISSSELSL